MIRVNVFREDVVLPEKISDAYIKNIVKKSALQCGLEHASVSVIFCNNVFIREINRNFRKKDYPTDVLSFPDEGEDFPGENENVQTAGEIYISVEKASEQAAEYNVRFRNEIKRLVVHGFLHLAGYDHELSAREEKRMFRKEEEILDILNG